MGDLIDRHIAWLRAGGAPDTTIRDRAGCLRRADAALSYGLEQAVEEEIGAWLARDLADWSRLTYFSHLWQFFAWATDPHREGLDFNPMAGLMRPRTPRGLPRPVSSGEMAVLLTACRPYLTWIKAAALQGLRCKEISGLNREDITQERIAIRDAKGGDPAYLGTHPDFWAEVQGLPDGPVAQRVDGSRGDPHYVSERGNKYIQKKLCLPGVTMHRIRHWFGTEMMEAAGGDLRVVQEALRHVTISSTQIYTKVSNARRDDAIARLRLPEAAA